MRITQETFDAAVQENIDEFDMEPEEALQDAVTQFQSQGANLSNIVKRVPGAEADDPAALSLVRKMKELLNMAEDEEQAEVSFGTGTLKITFGVCGATEATALSEAAGALRAEIQSDKQAATFAGQNGGMDALVSTALSVLRTPELLPPVLDALAVMSMDPENREQLDVRGVAALAIVLRTYGEGQPAVLKAALQAVRSAMLLHERHRQMFVESVGILPLALRTMRDYAEDEELRAPMTLAACGAIRTTTLSDDARSKTSKGCAQRGPNAHRLAVRARSCAACPVC